MLTNLDLRRRASAGAWHLLISAVVAGLAAALVFGLWYPGPFRALAGGRDLFLLVTSVDVVLGPVLTFAVFNRAKPLRELRRDLSIIGLLQLAGLTYGLHTVYIARPVAMVFEVDRLRLVTAVDVAVEELPKALPQYRELPVTGPWLLAARAPKDVEEHNDALFKGLAGSDISSRPAFWQPYETSIPAVLAKSRPVRDLLEHYPDKSGQLHELLRAMKVDPSTGRFLPAQARGYWSAVLDSDGAVRGYLPVDGFI